VNVGQIFSLLTRRLDDATSSGTPSLDNVYWSLAEGYCAVNEAQRQFALLTLCIEASGVLPLTASRCFYGIRGYLPGYLLPLRVSIGGVKLQPACLTELDARYNSWAATPGTPGKYMQIGLNLCAIIPQPTGASSATITFAREPSVLVATGDVPEIPEEYHPALSKYAAYYLLQKRGGQYLELAISLWNEFLADASQCADYVRRRNRARQYDHAPAEFRLPVKKEGSLTNA
jgi:hypothetical protein